MTRGAFLTAENNICITVRLYVTIIYKKKRNKNILQETRREKTRI